MHQAIKYFKYELAQLDEETGHFGLGKSLLMYLEIQINQGSKKEDKKQTSNRGNSNPLSARGKPPQPDSARSAAKPP